MDQSPALVGLDVEVFNLIVPGTGSGYQRVYSFFAGRDFTSLARMQAEALRWATDVYRLHKHRGLDGQTPATVFTALERDALMPVAARSV